MLGGGGGLSSGGDEPAVMWGGAEVWVEVAAAGGDKVAVSRNISKDLHIYEHSPLNRVISGALWPRNRASKPET